MYLLLSHISVCVCVWGAVSGCPLFVKGDFFQWVRVVGKKPLFLSTWACRGVWDQKGERTLTSLLSWPARLHACIRVWCGSLGDLTLLFFNCLHEVPSQKSIPNPKGLVYNLGRGLISFVIIVIFSARGLH